VSDRVLNLASPEGAAEYREYSASFFKEAYDFYEKAKNAEGLAFAADQLAEASRTSNEVEFPRVLVSMYENLLSYYPEKEQAAERVALYLKIARMHTRLNETAAVNTDFENALKVYRAYDDKEAKEGEARTYVDIGFVSGADVDIHKNVELALHTVRTLKDPAAEANTLRYVCKKYQQTWSKGSAPRPGFASETAQAADYCSRALELYRSVPDSRIQQAETLSDLGTINAANKPAAIENFQAAFNLYKDDERAERAALMLNIAAIQEEMGQLDQALKSFEAAKSILDKLDVMFDTLKAMRGVERVRAALQKNSARP
jgi:tetratricopeptide (TPR) repeat protein